MKYYLMHVKILFYNAIGFFKVNFVASSTIY